MDIWFNMCLALGGIMFFLLIVTWGVPLRMGLCKLRKKTFLIVDNDTHYTAPAVKKDSAEYIETKDGRAFGKTFRIKYLGGVKIGLAIPNEFVMTEPVISAAVEADNQKTDNPERYIKVENSPTKVMYNGKMVKLSELAKGLENKTVPTLIKAAMAQEAQEAVAAKAMEPAKWGMFILMLCIGLGFMAILLNKAGVI